MLEDIAVLTAGSRSSRIWACQPRRHQRRPKGEKVRRRQLPRPRKKIKIDAENTDHPPEGKGSKRHRRRAELIRKEIEKTRQQLTSREKLQERLASCRLAGGGVAVIKVGGATETARKERKRVYETPLAATKAAIE